MPFSHTLTLACSFVSPRPDAVDEHPHAEASGGSLTRLTLGRGDRLDVGFSSPCLSKKGHHALGCLRGNDLGTSIGVCSALFMRFVSRNCAVSAVISTMLASVHPASYGASDTPPRVSMRAFANAIAACRFRSPERPLPVQRDLLLGPSLSSSISSCARQGSRRSR